MQGQYATIMHTKPYDAVDEAVLSCLPLAHLPRGLRRHDAQTFSDAKEANHGGDSSVVDEGGLV